MSLTIFICASLISHSKMGKICVRFAIVDVVDGACKISDIYYLSVCVVFA